MVELVSSSLRERGLEEEGWVGRDEAWRERGTVEEGFEGWRGVEEVGLESIEEERGSGNEVMERRGREGGAMEGKKSARSGEEREGRKQSVESSVCGKR